MNESVKSREDYLRSEYWQKDGVKKAVSQFLGSRVLDWERWGHGDVQSEFLAISSREKLFRADKVSPASIIEPNEFSNAYYNHLGQIELQNSSWQRSVGDTHDSPSRVLFFWDIELYDNNNQLSPVQNGESTFNKLDKVNMHMEKIFTKYGISFQAIMSGRGYNYISQVDNESQVIDRLLDIAGNPEYTVLNKQRYPNKNNKRQKIVPIKAELLHMAAVRLQQFLFNQIINESRLSQPLPVEISDKGISGISLDNTAMMYSVENRSMGTLGSPYFIKLEKINPNYVKTIIKIPCKNSDISLSHEDALRIRSNYALTNELLGDVNCEIPESSSGIDRLIDDYKKSDLYIFHKKMDECFGDNPSNFDRYYRNYPAIAKQTEDPGRILHLMKNANDELLKPDNLDYFIWQVFKAWGGQKDFSIAGHVAGLLRSIYEDTSFNWGTRFTKNDAHRYARGWVMAVIGQAFEKP